MTALPLTTAQQGVWFAQQLDPHSTAFMTAERLELRGPVDDDALAAAIRAAVERAIPARSTRPDRHPCGL